MFLTQVKTQLLRIKFFCFLFFLKNQVNSKGEPKKWFSGQ
jgi:hypothetical protein